MSCSITSGIGIPCKKHKAGVKRLLFADEGVLEPTFTDNTISAFGGVTPTVIEFITDAEESGFSANGTNERSGSPFYTHNLTAIFHGVTAAKSAVVDSIVAGRKRVIVETYAENAGEGKYYLLGLESGLVAVNEFLGGTASGDPQGYSLTMTAVESTQPIECTSAAIADLTITSASL